MISYVEISSSLPDGSLIKIGFMKRHQRDCISKQQSPCRYASWASLKVFVVSQQMKR